MIVQNAVSVPLHSVSLRSDLICSVHVYARVHTSIYIYIYIYMGPWAGRVRAGAGPAGRARGKSEYSAPGHCLFALEM